MPARLLLVEDDPSVAKLMSRSLEASFEGTRVDLAGTCGEALRRFGETDYALVLLDLGLPDRSGLTLLPELRALKPEIPIVIITGRGSEQDIVAGLDAGADDYIAKSVSPDVLRARVAAALRRSTAAVAFDPIAQRVAAVRERDPGGDLLLVVGDLTLDSRARRARTPTGDVGLTPTELRLLTYLMEHVGAVVTRSAILEDVWGYDFDPGTTVLDVTLARLRAKLSAAAAGVQIQTLRAQGLTLKKA